MLIQAPSVLTIHTADLHESEHLFFFYQNETVSIMFVTFFFHKPEYTMHVSIVALFLQLCMLINCIITIYYYFFLQAVFGR